MPAPYLVQDYLSRHAFPKNEAKRLSLFLAQTRGQFLAVVNRIQSYFDRHRYEFPGHTGCWDPDHFLDKRFVADAKDLYRDVQWALLVHVRDDRPILFTVQYPRPWTEKYLIDLPQTEKVTWYPMGIVKPTAPVSPPQS